MSIGWPSNQKEWKLLIAITILLEFIFLQFIYTGSDNKDLVNLFSFGATLISIILALIAIFYSFLQTEAQKEDARFLAAQLSSLANVTDKLANSSDEVNSSIVEMKLFVDSLDKISDEVSKSREEIAKLDSKLGASTEVKKTEESNNANKNKAYTDALKEIFTLSTRARLISYACYLSHKKNKQMRASELINNHYLKPLGFVDDKQNTSNRKSINTGVAFGVLLTILPLGVRVNDENSKLNTEVSTFLDSYFKQGFPADTEENTEKLIAEQIEKSFD